MSSKPTVESEIGGLAGLGREALRNRWQELYGCAAPRSMSRKLLSQALAYRIQEQAFGGLSKATKAKLASLASAGKAKGGLHDGPSPRQGAKFRFKPGTRLLREWQGKTYEVIAIGDGEFLYDGRRHASLSRIAKLITGTQWSGPVFFGLKPRQAEAAGIDPARVP